MSEVIFGFETMRLDLEKENDISSINNDDVMEMIDYYMDQGFNYFDTGYTYHNGAAQEVLKIGLVGRYPRESFRIANKLPIWLVKSEADNEKYASEMLKNLGIDYFDVFLIHDLNEAFLPFVEKFKSFEYLQKMKDEGKARKIGFSYHDRSELLEKILEKYGEMIDVVQLQINYLDWESKLTEARKNYEVCEKYGKEVIVMEPLKGGTLFDLPAHIKEKFNENGMSLVEAALRFAGSPKNVTVVLSGVGNIEMMKENCKVFNPFNPIDEEEKDFMLSMADEIKKLIAIDCSYCGYCLDECPIGMPIPDYFELYNSEKMYSLHSFYSIYGALLATCPTASACTECGRCKNICTQKLNIPELLKDVADCFEGSYKRKIKRAIEKFIKKYCLR